MPKHKPTQAEVRALADKLANDPERLEPVSPGSSERLARDLLTGRLDADPDTGLPRYMSPGWED